MNHSETPVSPFLPLSMSNEFADLVIRAQVFRLVIGAEFSVMSASVTECLRGVVGAGDVLDVAVGDWEADADSEYYLFLITDGRAGSSGADASLLAATQSRRATLRAMSGLPPSLPHPSVVDLASLCESSDAVVSGVAVTISDNTARLRINRIEWNLLDDLPAEVDVTRGFELDEPGGPWEFSPSHNSKTKGVGDTYFLKRRDGRFLVMNPVSPGLLSRADVRLALSRWRESRQTPTSE